MKNELARPVDPWFGTQAHFPSSQGCKELEERVQRDLRMDGPVARAAWSVVLSTLSVCPTTPWGVRVGLHHPLLGPTQCTGKVGKERKFPRENPRKQSWASQGREEGWKRVEQQLRRIGRTTSGRPVKRRSFLSSLCIRCARVRDRAPSPHTHRLPHPGNQGLPRPTSGALAFLPRPHSGRPRSYLHHGCLLQGCKGVVSSSSRNSPT